MKSVSIGYYRDDGDFAVLATLNNKDEHLTDAEFERVWTHTLKMFDGYLLDESLLALEREDAPDYIAID